MKIRSHVVLAALTASVLGSIVGQGSVATAHTYTDWMARTWPSADRTAEWRFTSNVPSGTNFRNRVKDAAFTWNYLGQSMTFAHQQGDATPGTTWCTLAGATSLVDYVYIPEGYAGQHTGCGSGGYMRSFKIDFNSEYTWWTDTFPPSSPTLDAQGVATHEFGHATGRCCFTAEGKSAPAGGDTSGHFKWTSVNNLCVVNDVSRHTMCDGAGATESFYIRSLETHDKDIFNNAY